MSIFSDFFKKEAPLLGLQGSGGGLGFLAGGSNPVQVTGGTQTTIGSYLFIEFENGMPGTFTVDSGETEEAVILLAGGGGAGGCQVGGGGGGGGRGPDAGGGGATAAACAWAGISIGAEPAIG